MTKSKKREKTFEQKLQDGELFDIKAAAAQTGYSEQHLRRMCRAKPPRISHVLRGGTQFYFTPEAIAGVFKTVEAARA